ncbi:hypothetical protein Kpho01_45960 [Kitasatospora phosalacinea]|uniref:Uncharacterized protein n=2 Tax=Kitasatospora phosalacinea TaxID=2065 RepID=A0A9W6PI39_9ACTN|nr:hypothetical protein Kpho01_45960 [Kitasatospora phosalacinea]
MRHPHNAGAHGPSDPYAVRQATPARRTPAHPSSAPLRPRTKEPGMPFVADRTTAPTATTAAVAARAAQAPRRRRALPADPRTAAALQRALDRRDNGAPIGD